MHLNDQLYVQLSTYSMVGSAAILGGVTRMTISLTVILLEATGTISLLNEKVMCSKTCGR